MKAQEAEENSIKGNFTTFTLPDIIRMMKSRRMRLPGHVAFMGKKWNAYRVLMGKTEGKRPLGRPKHR
jgi:hypothetical protein